MIREEKEEKKEESRNKLAGRYQQPAIILKRVSYLKIFGVKHSLH
jgi:hypothetical protein